MYFKDVATRGIIISSSLLMAFEISLLIFGFFPFIDACKPCDLYTLLCHHHSISISLILKALK